MPSTAYLASGSVWMMTVKISTVLKKKHKQNIFTSVYLPSPSGTAQAPTGWQTGRLTNIFIVVCLLE